MAEATEVAGTEQRVTFEAAQALPTAKVVNRPQPIEEVHLDELLRLVVEKRGSDLHLASGVPPVIRVDGALLATNYEPMTDFEVQRMIYAILTDEQIRAFETEMELDCSYSLKGISRFRVNVYRDRGSCAGAFRVIPSKIPTIRELGLPIVLEELSRRPRGLVLVTGPTGSGKSTTLASVLGQINNERSTHIITIEDPIEYLHTHRRSLVNQRELGMDTRSFAQALKHSLRQDPDVILVGEMRDLETMALAVTAAETGHLVFSTVHTNNAAQSVDRIVDVFPPGQQEQIRIQLSNNLEAIISQQLLPRAGMPGRIAALEVMIASSAIRNLIRESKAHQITSTIQTGAHLGMQTMDQCLRDYYHRGLVTYEEAMARAMNPDELKKMLFSRGEEPSQ